MAQAQKSTDGGAMRKASLRNAGTGQFVYAYKVKGGARTLEKITPPKDATLVIIPEGAADQTYLESSSLVERYGQVRVQDAKGRIIAGVTDPATWGSSLLAVPGPSNRRRFPTVQFTDDGEVVDGLREVRQALPFRNPWAVLNFLVNPDARLGGRRPIDALKAGETDEVVEAARRIGQQGA